MAFIMSFWECFTILCSSCSTVSIDSPNPDNDDPTQPQATRDGAVRIKHSSKITIPKLDGEKYQN